jgi:hypothetical protein
VVYPRKFADWIPPEVAEERLQARRDRAMFNMLTKKPAVPSSDSYIRQNDEVRRAIHFERLEKMQSLKGDTMAGGLTRGQRADRADAARREAANTQLRKEAQSSETA